jgi:hypothetical protein
MFSQGVAFHDAALGAPPDQSFHLNALYQGPGKLDLRKMREIAVTRASTPS